MCCDGFGRLQCSHHSVLAVDMKIKPSLDSLCLKHRCDTAKDVFKNFIDLVDHDGIASACYVDCPVTDLARGLEFDALLFSRHKHAAFDHDTSALFLGHCFFYLLLFNNNAISAYA